MIGFWLDTDQILVGFPFQQILATQLLAVFRQESVQFLAVFCQKGLVVFDTKIFEFLSITGN